MNSTEFTGQDIEDPEAESFDNVHKVIVEADPSEPEQVVDTSEPDPDAIPPERRPLYLPSSYNSNPNHPLRQTELTLQIKQATQYLVALRDAIAEKSFQYSHVMRLAPKKGIQTRS